MDSSPDLSLKLRRGSSDSRDNFYMDFAQGIDSDIEEVDNTAMQRAPQQPPTPPPLPVVNDIDMVAIPSNIPPPPLGMAYGMGMGMGMMLPPPPTSSSSNIGPLPTLNESDDLPPTPPPHFGQDDEDNNPNSPPPPMSPTSVLEMVPPPMSPQSGQEAQPPSPPVETEDEGDDADVEETPDEEENEVTDQRDNEPELEDIVTAPNEDSEETEEKDEDDDDDEDDKSTPPPPLPPLPSNLSYIHGSGAHGTALSSLSPTLTKSPSTSPSPPVTPPPGHKATVMSSPPPPPLTPPSESDQSQPNSPPPRSKSKSSVSSHHRQSGEQEVIAASPPAPADDADSELMAALAAAARDHEPVEDREAIVNALMNQLSDEAHTYNEEESTTITTPPSNGFSASSILAPPGEELEEDGSNEEELCLADIPPPDGIDDEDQDEEEDEDQKTPTSEGVVPPTIDDPTITEGTEADDEEEDDVGQPIEEEDDRQATPIPTPPVSTTPKRRDSTGAGGSRAASRPASRSSSIRTASRSGSVRGGAGAGGSITSRSGSIAAASSSIASGVQPVVGIGITSPPTSIKSFRSQSSIKSSHSKKVISSPPPTLHSPPIVTSPPRIYSPPEISIPQQKQILEADPMDDGTDMAPSAPSPSPPSQSSPPQGKKIDSPVKSTGTGTESLGGATGAGVGAKELSEVAIASAPIAASASATSSRPHLSSHHHYHLPHQFQHPHHQNHHTHSHGSVPVPTPTVPASYMLHEVRHIRAASGGTSDECGSIGKPSTSSFRRSSPPTPPTAAVPSPNLPGSSDTASLVFGSPTKSTARIRDSTSQHRVTIDEANLPTASGHHHVVDMNGGGPGHGPRRGGSDDGSEPSTPGSCTQDQLAGDGDGRPPGHLALMYHSHQLSNYPVMPAIKRIHRPSFVYPPMPRVKAGDALATLFSALYGKILVVMGIAFPMAEVISTYIPPSFYEVYYLYLYIGSMIFLLFMYATLLWGRPKIPTSSPTKSTIKTRSTSASESMDESDTDSNSIRNKHIPSVATARRPSLLSPLGRQHHYGSFYLRMGAVAFGIGSMIYSGLEFGQYFELNPDTKCHNVLLALTPATRMAFIFIQMYFIFLNNEQIKVYRYKIIARFGLMHMIGTNLAVWLNVLIQETKHEILTFYNPENRTLRISHRIPGHSRGAASHAVVVPALDPTAHLRVPRGLKGPYQIFECRRTNILGTLVQDASPFLFPCTIEYSLICAAILYVMWRSISRPQTPTPQRPDTISSPMKRSPHHYSVDCARAHKGLFVGILILVLTIISLILFFVLISRPDFVSLAVTEVTICELLIYGTATIATLVGMIQIRHLQYDAYRSFSLDDILLVGAQTGSFLYNIFTVIAGQFTLRSDDMLVPINALASIVQTACQTMFILDASRRQAVSPEHIRKKPGREIVTFMLVVNLAMWAISTLEKSRAESHPIQLNFYGLWAWTIITHVSMPLAIFYRFHSTVCLCEIWKRAYKLKPTYM